MSIKEALEWEELWEEIKRGEETISEITMGSGNKKKKDKKTRFPCLLFNIIVIIFLIGISILVLAINSLFDAKDLVKSIMLFVISSIMIIGSCIYLVAIFFWYCFRKTCNFSILKEIEP